ncbi:hypothetical protein niasHT_018718 [Heterodera trifolii]|uniref:BTB domain-containing protein n=1 Tax=Heterodera trifolii TaxID=157864 RepID=A0ABD2LC80_9BILA
MPSSMDRMKHLLSTGEHSDVQFLVLPAHQFILKIASDVFEAMFRFDAKKERPENASANGPVVVEIPDIEPSAFKVMLSFIYTDDLSALNGDNAMAVLYAANKYNIPDLVLPSLQIPISELRNVFFAYAQALLFELEDFAIKCLRYICQNAAQLFGSDDFLQPMKNVVRMALNAPREIVVLFLVRHFLSGVLTTEELLGIYQFNSHPYLFFRGVPGLYSLKFPSHGRIFNWNKARANRRGTLALEIEKVSDFAGEIIGSERRSETVHIKGLPWKIWADIKKKKGSTDNNEKWLSFSLLCDAPKEDENWSCECSSIYRIVSQNSGFADYKRGEFSLTFNNKSNSWGYSNFISFAELMDPCNGLYEKKRTK